VLMDHPVQFSGFDLLALRHLGNEQKNELSHAASLLS
jgi:hypothetical protein